MTRFLMRVLVVLWLAVLLAVSAGAAVLSAVLFVFGAEPLPGHYRDNKEPEDET